MAELFLTHRQIEAFRAVMLTASMTDAARMLSVTQPAVSKIMAQLESELGFALFDRRQGGLRPTNEAYLLYSEVERSYSGLEQVTRAAARIRNRTGGRLRIAALPTFSSGFLPLVVKRLRAGDAQIELSLQNYNSEEVIDLVASGLCDLGFAMTPVDATRVQVGAVMTAPTYCLLPDGHRLTQKRVLSARDLEGEEFIATAEGTSSRLRTDALFASMNITRKISLEARWATTIAGLVRAGLGCAILDAFTALWFAETGGEIRPMKERVDFTFVCLQPRASETSGLAKRFMEAFELEFAALRERCAALEAEG